MRSCGNMDRITRRIKLKVARGTRHQNGRSVCVRTRRIAHHLACGIGDLKLFEPTAMWSAGHAARPAGPHTELLRPIRTAAGNTSCRLQDGRPHPAHDLQVKGSGQRVTLRTCEVFVLAGCSLGVSPESNCLRLAIRRSSRAVISWSAVTSSRAWSSFRESVPVSRGLLSRSGWGPENGCPCIAGSVFQAVSAGRH
jgi:hypothetical protein